MTCGAPNRGNTAQSMNGRRVGKRFRRAAIQPACCWAKSTAVLRAMRRGAVSTMRRCAGSTRSEARRARALRTNVTGRLIPACSISRGSESALGLAAEVDPKRKNPTMVSFYRRMQRATSMIVRLLPPPAQPVEWRRGPSGTLLPDDDGSSIVPLISPAASWLVVVAKVGSIRRAAAQLNVSASAVDRQILKLEAEYGAQLFERLPRGLRPTVAGGVLVAEIERWQQEHDRAIRT